MQERRHLSRNGFLGAGLTVILLAAGRPAARQVDTQAMARMAATERAFAAATTEVGVRDGFLAFFSEDSIAIRAGAAGTPATVGSARAGLKGLPLEPLPVGVRLMWEPFTGHVSSDGTLGWLTGGYARLNQPSREIQGQGAYFSVWKRQADQTWRVWLDEGISLPEVWRDAAPFRAAPEPDAGTEGAAGETIAAAERAVETGGASWRARLAAAVRLHRDGRMPFVGRDRAIAWASSLSTVRYTVVRTEVALSGDLAIALGGYDATGGNGAEHGTWVRAWKRDVTDRWRIVFETSKAAPR